jgi:hypothetical protein
LAARKRGAAKADEWLVGKVARTLTVDNPKSHEGVEKQLDKLGRAEHSILAAQRKALHAQDVTNILMVLATSLMALATAFGAFASWRMARVASDIFRASERPYVGVESIRLDTTNTARPTSWVTFRNFGSVPADQTVIDVSTSIDGHLAPGGLGHKHVVLSLGVLTPQTTYLFGALFPGQLARAVVEGESQIVVSVKAGYKDAAGQRYCFAMNYIYYWPLKKYDPAGGSDECAGGAPVYSDATTLLRQMAPGRH